MYGRPRPEVLLCAWATSGDISKVKLKTLALLIRRPGPAGMYRFPCRKSLVLHIHSRENTDYVVSTSESQRHNYDVSKLPPRHILQCAVCRCVDVRLCCVRMWSFDRDLFALGKQSNSQPIDCPLALARTARRQHSPTRSRALAAE